MCIYIYNLLYNNIMVHPKMPCDRKNTPLGFVSMFQGAFLVKPTVLNSKSIKSINQSSCIMNVACLAGCALYSEWA